MNGREGLSPSLPLWCSVPVAAVLCLFIAYRLLRTRTWPERYLIIACSLRYLVSAFHDFTYRLAPGGLSYIALVSIGLVALGALTLDKRRLFIGAFLPVIVICVLMLASGVLNHDPKSALEPIVRNAFFIVIAVAVWQTVDVAGPQALTRLLVVFVQPIIFQVLSIALHVAKAGESDGSVSYIGGYNHEQVFSLILASCFVVATFASRISRWAKLAISGLSIVGIGLANYRTTILGMVPLLIVQLFTAVPRAVPLQQRGLVRSAMLALAVCAAAGAIAVDPTRFSDIAKVATHGTGLIKPPHEFSADDRRVLSGRIYIWSSYLYAYNEATPTQKVFGTGPDAWAEQFRFYAHNTLISYLYELGVLGVAAILLLWGTMLSIAWHVPGTMRAQVLGAHASFFLLNMATMPHWQIEGNILYGLICGYTLALARPGRPAGRAQPRLRQAPYEPEASRGSPSAPSMTSQ
ncbi:O-antigen ligase family protein [Sphingomonas sp. URHD0057]|uniref:O-antigen ligase family protein n=1 Tax=Sphingomonas sp. URHD0057 TaxID=1380389 RepID=UPI00048FDF7B|nr:O-antigen ligase family protein [Sphingomonas sp. URHD0057]